MAEAMLMYKLSEYSEKHCQTFGSLWLYSRVEQNSNNNVDINDDKSKLFR